MLRIVSLGGLGRIGGNMTAIETATSLVLIDCGLLFPTTDHPGVDYILPDISYLHDRKEKLRGIVLTHAHEDHIGAIPYLFEELRVPIYGSKFTLGLVGAKLGEFPACRPELRRLADGDSVELGDLAVRAIPVTHSIPGALALAFTTPLGVLIHTGDFKLDLEPLDQRRTDEATLKRLGDEGVLALLSDSTNACRDGHTYGEAAAANALAELIAEAPFRVAVTAFSSNIFRLRSIITASEAAQRKVVLAGRSVEKNVSLAIEQGLITPAPGTLCSPEEFSRLPRSAVTIIAAGTQGEPRSTLSRIAIGHHGDIKLEPKDRVIFSSRRIPGNERPIANVVNNLYRLGLEVIDDHARGVHASGHAFAEELRAMLSWCRPRFFVPIHGEYRHLCHHAELAHASGVARDEIFILDDGHPLDLEREGERVVARRAAPVPVGFAYVDGDRVGSTADGLLSDRRVLAETGFVACAVTFDKRGQLVARPQVHTRGLMSERESTALLDEAAVVVERALTELGPDADHESRGNEIRVVLRRFLRRELDRRPLIVPIVTTI